MPGRKVGSPRQAVGQRPLPRDASAAREPTIRVLIADGQRMLLEPLAQFLARSPGLAVVATATDGQAAAEKAETTKPDIAILDRFLPRLSGLAVARRIEERLPTISVILLSESRDDHFVVEAFRAGVKAYLDKERPVRELLTVIRQVANGGTCLSRHYSGLLAEALRNPRSHDLTAREREVLALIADGRSTKEISHSLSITTRTAGHYRERIMGKLGLHTAVMLTRYAIREGLVRP